MLPPNLAWVISLMSSQTEQIKAKLSIVDVVGSYLKLEKVGNNFKARCPFHNEKTPSFYVSPTRDSWHCFGCNRGGDIFSFVQEIEGLDFMGALESLARRAGIELKPLDPKIKTESERAHAVMEEAVKFYHTNLLQSDLAKDYVKQRGLNESTVRTFRLGYAPTDWSALYDYLGHKGFTDDEIEKTGLIIKTANAVRHAGGRYFDRFRGRVMFPINDPAGRPIGFSGRLVVASPGRDEAKYINTPQTPLYDKSRALFGFDLAKQAIRQHNACVLVEGQMDLVMSRQVGVQNVVAVSGTALTLNHLNLIKRLSENLIMAFDGDTAGIKAARRGIDLALSLGLEVKIALLPDGLDPADLAKTAGQAWSQAVAGATNVIDFYLAALARSQSDQRTLNRRVVQEVLPYVARLENSIDQANFVSKIATFVGTTEEPIWVELKKIQANLSLAVETPVANIEFAVEEVSRREKLDRQVLGLWWWLESQAKPELTALVAKITTVVGEKKEELTQPFATDRDTLILEAELTYDGVANLERTIFDLLNEWQIANLRDELTLLLKRIKLAETAGQETELTELLKTHQMLNEKLNNLKNN